MSRFLDVLWGGRRLDAAAQEMRARELTRPTTSNVDVQPLDAPRDVAYRDTHDRWLREPTQENLLAMLSARAARYRHAHAEQPRDAS